MGFDSPVQLQESSYVYSVIGGMMDEIKDNYHVIRNTQFEVSLHVRGLRGWIAQQRIDDPGEWWGFVIDRKFGCIEIEAHRKALAENADAEYRRIAAEMLGYEVDSAEYYQNIWAQHVENRDGLERQLHALMNQKKAMEAEGDRLSKVLERFGISASYIPPEGSGA